MLNNIEEIIRGAGVLHVEPERYGDGIMVCMDILTTVNNATDQQDGTLCYTGCEIRDAVEAAASPGDVEAMKAMEKLDSFAALHPEFLYIKGRTLTEALLDLEDRAALWNDLADGVYTTSKAQNKILLDFTALE